MNPKVVIKQPLDSNENVCPLEDVWFSNNMISGFNLKGTYGSLIPQGRKWKQLKDTLFVIDRADQEYPVIKKQRDFCVLFVKHNLGVFLTTKNHKNGLVSISEVDYSEYSGEVDLCCGVTLKNKPRTEEIESIPEEIESIPEEIESTPDLDPDDSRMIKPQNTTKLEDGSVGPRTIYSGDCIVDGCTCEINIGHEPKPEEIESIPDLESDSVKITPQNTIELEAGCLNPNKVYEVRADRNMIYSGEWVVDRSANEIKLKYKPKPEEKKKKEKGITQMINETEKGITQMINKTKQTLKDMEQPLKQYVTLRALEFLVSTIFPQISTAKIESVLRKVTSLGTKGTLKMMILGNDRLRELVKEIFQEITKELCNEAPTIKNDVDNGGSSGNEDLSTKKDAPKRKKAAK